VKIKIVESKTLTTIIMIRLITVAFISIYLFWRYESTTCYEYLLPEKFNVKVKETSCPGVGC